MGGYAMGYLQATLVLLYLLACGLQVCRGQSITSVEAEDVTVVYRTEAVLRCTVEYTGAGAIESIVIEKAEGSPSTTESSTDSEVPGQVTQELAFPSPLYSDEGEYICRATLGSVSQNTTFYFTVQNVFAFLTTPNNQTVSLGTTVFFNCIPNQYDTRFWLKDGELFPETDFSFTIMNATFYDMGTYTCVADYLGVRYNASGTLTIEEYVALYNDGTFGDGAVSTDDQRVVECPVRGNPGPSLIYWVTQDGKNVTTMVNRTGPYVNERGELVLSNASPDDSGFYTCIGVDNVTDTSVSQRFYIEVEDEGSSLWTRWYFILLYCVVGAIVVGLVIAAVVFSIAIHDAWLVKVTKVVRVKKRVRRSKVRV